MGCDIHGYIEYKENDNSDYWNFGEQFGNRDYVMFGFLAGVRGIGCIFSPKGVPENVAWRTKSDYYLFVADKDTDSEGCCSRENAIRWVNQGSSQWADSEHKFITHPDWHTPSWLSCEEFETVLIKRRNEIDWGYGKEWDAILAAMKVLPNSRFVFWFDN